MTDMRGRTALITGGCTGIGLGIAKALGAAGSRIALHGLPGEQAAGNACRELAKAGAADVEFFAADLRIPDEIGSLMTRVLDWSPIDVLVNNAGIQSTGSLSTMPGNKWDEIIAVNLSAAFHTMKAAMPAMAERGYGRVVNVASVHGLVASINKAPYTAAKFGLVGLSKVAALEYATAGNRESGGVTVNCICPGWTETALLEPQITARANELGVDRSQAIADLLAEKQPSRRTATTAEIGELALWLCSPVAHNITGATIPMDGGWVSQ